MRCVPVVDALQGGQAGQHQDSFYEEQDTLVVEEPLLGKAGDERTEIILAATFLLMVILSFVAFIIHRCERSLYHRSHQTCSSMPKSLSSVSIQTVPIMSSSTFSNGEIQTISRTLNGGSRYTEDIYTQDRRNLGEPVQQPLYLYRQLSIQSRDHLPESRPESHLLTPQDPHLPSQQDPHQFRLQCEEMVENIISTNDTLEKSDYKKDQTM